MKTSVALLCALALVPAHFAQTAGPTTPAQAAVPNGVSPPEKAAPADKATASKAATAKAAPATKGAVDPKAKKVEPPAKIEGVTIPRGKNFLGIQIVNSTFKLSFYDDKKKPVTADVPRAVLRWDPKYKVGKERVLLSVGEDGKSLTSPRAIRPPYVFKLFITLLKDATENEEPVGESFVIDFQA